MGEIAVRSAVERDALHPEPFEQPGQYDAADGIDAVQHDLEAGLPDGIRIHRIQGEDCIYVFVREIVVRDLPEAVDSGEVEFPFLRKVQDRLPFRRSEEFSRGVQQLERVPVARIVAGGDDDAAVRSGERDSKFRGRSAGESAAHDVHAAGDQGSAD